jgi:hypothetical protein
MNINQNAPVISRQEILIKAPVESIWKIHTAVIDWHNWNPGISESEISDPLAVGTTFHWQTAGLKISSKIREVFPPGRIGRSGETAGILGIHVWTFPENSGGTLVRTEESWEGLALPPIVRDVQKANDASLISWLSCLKQWAKGTTSHVGVDLRRKSYRA